MKFPVKRKVRLFKVTGVLLLLIFALIYSHDEVGMSGNESGRFATVQAIAEQGVFYIEKCNFRTVDRSLRNGHIYYDKLPFLSLVMAGVYYPFHRLGGLNFVDNYYFSIYLLNFIFGAAINILLFLWLFDLFRRVPRGSVEIKFLLSLSCVAGSWLLSYSTMLNNHTPAALAVAGLLVALSRYERKAHWKAALLAGCAAGFAGVVELPCGFFMGAAAVAAVWMSAPREKRLSHTGAVIAAGAFWAAAGAVLNHIAYGSWLPLYFAGQGGQGTYAPSIHPDLFYYGYHIFIGDRGLFSYTPFLLLGAAAFLFPRRKVLKYDLILLAAMCGFMLFYLTCTNEFGGQSYGFRYFIPMIPLLWFWGGRWFLLLPAAKWKAPLLAVLIIWGVVTGLGGAYHPFCIGNEGVRSPEGHFARNFSSFGGNLLCWSYENFPESSLTHRLYSRYGLFECVQYLYWSYFHQKKITLLKKMQLDFPELYPGRKANASR